MVYSTYLSVRRQRQREWWQAQGQRELLRERQRLERRQSPSSGGQATHRFLLTNVGSF